MLAEQLTVKQSMKYARDVVAGRIIACTLVKQTCERQLDDLKNGHKRGLKWIPERAQDALDWFSFHDHVKGSKAGTPIILEPWQAFFIACVFGWYRWTAEAAQMHGSVKGDPLTWPRRFIKFYLECARKQGKSTMLAPIGTYMAYGDGEAAAEVYSVATTREQAKIIFNTALAMVKKSTILKSIFEPLKTAITAEDSDSSFKPLSSDYNTLDGLNTSCGLVDELHAHKKREVLEVVESSTGTRKSPLIGIITTAGVDQNGICYEERTHLVNVLNKVYEDDELFGAIYTMDEGDLGKDNSEPERLLEHPELLIKANPNIGISASGDKILKQLDTALQMPGKMSKVLRYYFNIWVGAANAWMNMIKWNKQPDRLPISEFSGESCLLALDLASKIDLACLQQLFVKDDVYHVYTKFYLPRSALENEKTPRRIRKLYKLWEKEGLLTVTEGERIDETVIEDHIREISAEFDVKELIIDPWHAHRIAANMAEEGVTVVELAQTPKNISEAMKECEAKVLELKIAHGYNSILTWNMGNVVRRVYTNDQGNYFPAKESDYLKIDGAVTLFMNIARQLVLVGKKPSVYDTRDPVTL